MCDVDHSVLGLCKLLEDVTPQGIDCLRGFLDPRCLEFVGWLKNNMKGILVISIIVSFLKKMILICRN